MHCHFRLAIALLFSVALALSSAPAECKDKEFFESVEQLFSRHRGKVAAAVKHLDNGESYSWNATAPMPTASLIKLPIMAAAYRAVDAGELKLDAMLTLSEDDKVPGSGVLTPNFSGGTKLALRDAIQLMIAFSDNTATNLVIDQVGLEATRTMAAKLGCTETQLHAKVFRRDTSIAPERSKRFGLGSTTAADMVKLLGMLNQGELASKTSCDAMMEHLRDCQTSRRVSRLLPKGIVVAHKTGSVSAVRTDAGIIESPSGPIAFCFLTADNADRRWADDNEADLLAAEFGRVVYEHFQGGKKARVAPAARVLVLGADGLLVESLQRTLNARTKPSVDISVDGDFGPDTEAAVMAFQRQAKLEPTGKVDAATWTALSPIVSKDAPAPAPEVVNAKIQPKAEPDSLDGPPVVTCKAYAIADGATGKVLWGFNDSKPRPPASTTKIMTALLVARYAEKHPESLDEIVTFSERADKTGGSTSGVRAGEKLSVGDLLYGLMLPSGNDASVALAEHFGDRLAVDSSIQGEAYERFIGAMNQAATELGMSDSHFENTHGRSAEGHAMSARDLVRLSMETMKSSLLKEIIATRLRGQRLDSVSGYQRDVVWKNTNRLLRIKGFFGVKTGTTGPAGACLASIGERSGKRLVVIVLGSTSSDARYVDARNLYRWAWRQLGQKSSEGAQ